MSSEVDQHETKIEFGSLKATFEDVAAAYRVFLGRTAEDESVVAEKVGISLSQLAELMISSPEFQDAVLPVLLSKIEFPPNLYATPLSVTELAWLQDALRLSPNHLRLSDTISNRLVAGMQLQPTSVEPESILTEFDSSWYSSEYPEIAAVEANLSAHYAAFGKSEARYQQFDASWYRNEYHDVAKSGCDPISHYRSRGRSEGRLPGFDKNFYLEVYPDIAAAGIDPYLHYVLVGRTEGRLPGFSRAWYLAEYPDVATTGMDAMVHYRLHGRSEGRKAAPTTTEILREAVRLSSFAAPYRSDFQPREEFTDQTTDVRAIAFYLPQFHRCEQNDRWWGEGFTEWTNTRQAKSRFQGHYQPREPHKSIGYYDLSLAEDLRKQATLAKSHGIHGFCFYHYWFSGKRVLERPLDTLLANADIELPFLICWANENWTRTWDGLDNDILLEQKYLPNDPEAFISDALPYLRDQRYIRAGGKIVIMVYRAHVIPNVGDVFARWRETWRRETGEELLIWVARTNPADPAMSLLSGFIDAVVEFPPHVIPSSNHPSRYHLRAEDLGFSSSGNYFDYDRLVEDVVAGSTFGPAPQTDFYRSVMLGWDNSARRVEGWSVWLGFSLARYDQWLRHTIRFARARFAAERRFVFINAWNEWAEGTYLEPDTRSGYAVINTTARALFDLPYRPTPQVTDQSRHLTGSSAMGRVAVHLHLYHLDLLEEFIDYLSNVPQCFDLFVTLCDRSAVETVRHSMSCIPTVEKLSVIVTPNVGRDIAPFLVDVLPRVAGYDLVGHVHSKKSATVTWGDHWRRYLLNNLLGTSQSINAIFSRFVEDASLGLLYPPAYPLIAPHMGWAGLESRCRELLDGLSCHPLLPDHPEFPAGNMFWARVTAIEPMRSRAWSYDDFEPEAGQIGQTLGHCVERVWRYVAAWTGYRTEETLAREVPTHPNTVYARKPLRAVLFVHYDPDDMISTADVELVRALDRDVGKVFMVTNSEIGGRDARLISPYVAHVLRRANVGLDFAAWRDLIARVGWSTLREFDEVVLVNNSCYGPIFPFDEMMSSMMSRDVDFWGISSFPDSPQSPRPEAAYLPNRHITRHVQSYFIVLRRRVVEGLEIEEFFDAVEDKLDFMDVVTSYEVGLTRKLVEAGYSWAAYIPEAEYLQASHAHEPRYNAPYSSPLELMLLRTPMLKKRAVDYAPGSITEIRRLLRSFGVYPPHLVE